MSPTSSFAANESSKARATRNGRKTQHINLIPGQEHTFIRQLGQYDVLLGRGTGPNDHNGNMIFRNFICRTLRQFQEAPTRRAKNDVAVATIRAIRKKKGRFVIRMCREECEHIKGWNGRTALHILIEDVDLVLEKTKQCYRHNLRKENFLNDGGEIPEDCLDAGDYKPFDEDDLGGLGGIKSGGSILEMSPEERELLITSTVTDVPVEKKPAPVFVKRAPKPKKAVKEPDSVGYRGNTVHRSQREVYPDLPPRSRPALMHNDAQVAGNRSEQRVWDTSDTPPYSRPTGTAPQYFTESQPTSLPVPTAFPSPHRMAATGYYNSTTASLPHSPTRFYGSPQYHATFSNTHFQPVSYHPQHQHQHPLLGPPVAMFAPTASFCPHQVNGYFPPAPAIAIPSPAPIAPPSPMSSAIKVVKKKKPKSRKHKMIKKAMELLRAADACDD